MSEPLAPHHLAVVVRDLEASERFYREVLCLPLLKRHHDEKGPRAVWLALAGGAFLALERCEQTTLPGRDAGAPGFHCVALGIASSERAAWRTRLELAGYPIVRESPYTLYVHDPDHCLVALSHYPSEAP